MNRGKSKKMDSFLFDILAFEENLDQYTPEEQRELLNEIKEKIAKAKKKKTIYTLLKAINNI